MRKGFSLIEMLIVMAIFLTMMLVVSDIFLSVSATQRKTIAYQKAVNELQLNFEEMLHTLRFEKIDYDVITPETPMPTDKITLSREDGFTIEFFIGTENCPNKISTCLVRREFNNIQTIDYVISGGRVKVNQLHFYIYPLEERYSGRFAVQSRITVVIQAEVLMPADQPSEEIQLQSTVTMRNYET
jgi:prepilin-type N-terminal cleavage/methylation domain-containing protein